MNNNLVVLIAIFVAIIALFVIVGDLTTREAPPPTPSVAAPEISPERRYMLEERHLRRQLEREFCRIEAEQRGKFFHSCW